jgi:hypothetical protein
VEAMALFMCGFRTLIYAKIIPLSSLNKILYLSEYSYMKTDAHTCVLIYFVAFYRVGIRRFKINYNITKGILVTFTTFTLLKFKEAGVLYFKVHIHCAGLPRCRK